MICLEISSDSRSVIATIAETLKRCPPRPAVPGPGGDPRPPQIQTPTNLNSATVTIQSLWFSNLPSRRTIRVMSSQQAGGPSRRKAGGAGKKGKVFLEDKVSGDHDSGWTTSPFSHLMNISPFSAPSRRVFTAEGQRVPSQTPIRIHYRQLNPVSPLVRSPLVNVKYHIFQRSDRREPRVQAQSERSRSRR